MSATRPVFRRFAAGLLLGSVLFLPGCLNVLTPSTRVAVANANINGQPASLILDTGAFSSGLTASGARRLGLETTLVPDFVINDAGAIWQTEPTEAHFGDNTFMGSFLVYSGVQFPWYLKFIASEDMNIGDGVLGWAEVRDNILVFDPARRTIRAVSELPPETAQWQKFKILNREQLCVEIPLADGRLVEMVMDTGAPKGIDLPSPLWKAWLAAHPQAQTETTHYAAPGTSFQFSVKAWADAVSLGALTLTDVPVAEYTDDVPAESAQGRLFGFMGLEAMARMKIVLDAKNGFAYLQPLLAPDPSSPGSEQAEAPAAADPNRDWILEGDYKLSFAQLHALGAYTQGLVAMRQHDTTGALAAFDQAIASYADGPYLYRTRGSARFVHGDYAGSAADYSRAIELNPANPKYYVGRAEAESAQGDYAAAVADDTRALQIDPHNIPAYFSRSAAEKERGHFDAALADLGQLAKLAPEDASVSAARALVRLLQGDDPAAQAELAAALRLDAKSGLARGLLGIVAQLRGDDRAAVADYNRALQLNISPAQATNLQFYRQLSLLRQGQPSDDLARAVAQWTEGWDKSAGLFITGQTDETTLLAAATQGEPALAAEHAISAHYYIGMKHLLAGDAAGARLHFQAVLEADKPGRVVTLFARAELARLGPPPAPAP